MKGVLAMGLEQTPIAGKTRRVWGWGGEGRDAQGSGEGDCGAWEQLVSTKGRSAANLKGQAGRSSVSGGSVLLWVRRGALAQDPTEHSTPVFQTTTGLPGAFP